MYFEREELHRLLVIIMVISMGASALPAQFNPEGDVERSDGSDLDPTSSGSTGDHASSPGRSADGALVPGSRGPAKDDWPQFKRDSTGSGNSDALVPNYGGVLWETGLDEPVLGSPVISDGTIYIVDEGGTLYAISTDDGGIQWQKTLGFQAASTPAVYGDDIFVTVEAAPNSTLFCLDKSDGTENWRFLADHDVHIVVAIPVDGDRHDHAEVGMQDIILFLLLQKTALGVARFCSCTNVLKVSKLVDKFTTQ